MKKILTYITTVSLSALMFGCAAINSFFERIDENQMAVITAAVTVSTNIGVKAAINSTNDKDKKEAIVLAFKSVDEVITLAINANSYEPALLKNFIAESLGTSNPYLPIVNSALDTAVAAYQVFYAANWKETIDSQVVMKKFLTAIQTGIQSAIQNVTLPAMSKPNKPLSTFTAADLTVIK